MATYFITEAAAMRGLTPLFKQHEADQAAAAAAVAQAKKARRAAAYQARKTPPSHQQDSTRPATLNFEGTP